MGDPMKIRAQLMADQVLVRALMAHPMETGFRKNPDGSTVPAWYIDEVTVKCNERVVLHAFWGPSVAKNPYLSFKFKGGKAGDRVSITWKDTHGDSRSDSVEVQSL